MKQLGFESKTGARSRRPAALRRDHARPLGTQERRIRQACRNGTIDEWYELGRANGAIGGKLIGAGGGGFLMFYTEDKTRLRHAMREVGLREVRFRFDFRGDHAGDSVLT